MKFQEKFQLNQLKLRDIKKLKYDSFVGGFHVGLALCLTEKVVEKIKNKEELSDVLISSSLLVGVAIYGAALYFKDKVEE